MYTVVCFGDTNTWGYDNRSGDRLPYDERWTGMLAKELGADFRVIEEGLPGRATTEDPVESGKNARAQIGVPFPVSWTVKMKKKQKET